jgi:pyrroline-5-carboxylate reductase
MEAVGQGHRDPRAHQDAVTAISGSGPAYLFFVVEAMIDAGVLLGLPRDGLHHAGHQTMYGSAKLLDESGRAPTCCASA